MILFSIQKISSSFIAAIICDAHIHFINEELIEPVIWQKAEEIVSQIDVDDIAFVALTRHLESALWTGDKRLYNTTELIKLRNRLTSK